MEAFLLKTLSLSEMFVLNVFFFPEIVTVVINWYQDFVSSNSVSNHTCDRLVGLPLCGRPILFITHMITDRIGRNEVLLRHHRGETSTIVKAREKCEIILLN